MKIAVIGAGSWGTALAQVLSDAGSDVVIWARRQEVADGINNHHANPDFLSKFELSSSITSTTSISDALDGATAAVIVVPSKYLRQTAQNMAPYVDNSLKIVICSKGVESQTGLLPEQIFEQELGNNERLATLSGPTHAEEVIAKIASGAVIASIELQCAHFFRDLFATEYFRTYTSDDVIGVELCAAFKNVIAIAVGISYGLGYGDDTAAMLITRGLAEMSRMVLASGGKEMTCMGLAGAGDMIVTCMSRHSRNRRFGQDYIACGKNLEDFESDTHMVVEGAIACKTLDVLSEKHDVELPLTDAIRRIVWQGESARDIAKELIERPLKDEFHTA